MITDSTTWVCCNLSHKHPPYSARIAKPDKCYDKSKVDFANPHSTSSLSEKSIAFEEGVWSLDQARVR